MNAGTCDTRARIAFTLFTSSISVVYLTNRFHFAVVCSVIDTRYDVKRGKNKKVAHEPLGECLNVYTLFIIFKAARLFTVFLLNAQLCALAFRLVILCIQTQYLVKYFLKLQAN